MEIKEIHENKKDFLDLLLLADEQEEMVDKYLQDGRMFVLTDNGVKGEVVVTNEGNGILEIKNIATDPSCHEKATVKSLFSLWKKNLRENILFFRLEQATVPLQFPSTKNADSSAHT